MIRDLRPIGTEFWGEPWTSAITGDSGLRRFLYRVVSHDKCQVGGSVKTLEVIKAIRSQRQECIGIEFVGPEYLGPGYKRLFDGVWKDEP